MSAAGRLLVGTAGGLYDGGGRSLIADRRVTALSARLDGGHLAVLDGAELWAGEGVRWDRLATLAEAADLGGELSATCVAAIDGRVLVGTSEAHLLTADGAGRLRRESAFDEAPGRERWYTPWGGPPDTRSIAVSPAGDVYVGVHVGGILRAPGGSGPWVPTIDVDADVHQVATAAGGEVLVACALGFASSGDRGESWHFVTAGLHGAYSRAVAVAGEWTLLSSSTGPSTARAAVYRRPLAAAGTDEPFVRCAGGLPEWFGANIDTGHLTAAGDTAAVATPEGTIFLSGDSGASWREVAGGLPPVTALALSS